MTVPSTAFKLLGQSMLSGAVLGLLYSFLRPLRPRHTVAADSLFSLALLWTFLWVSFGVCGGDIRLGNLVGQLLGGIAAERTLGRLLGPIFRSFWRGMGRIRRLILAPAKNFSDLRKFCLHLRKNGLQ